MKHHGLLTTVLGGCWVAILAGCAANPSLTTPTTTPNTTSSGSGASTSGASGTSLAHLRSPTILVSEAHAGGEHVLAFDGIANGETKPYWTMEGTHPSSTRPGTSISSDVSLRTCVAPKPARGSRCTARTCPQPHLCAPCLQDQGRRFRS